MEGDPLSGTHRGEFTCRFRAAERPVESEIRLATENTIG
jgi:hypothetical protein